MRLLKIIFPLVVLVISVNSMHAQNSFPSSGEVHISSDTYTDPVLGFPFGLKVGGGGIAVSGASVFNDNVGIGTTSPQKALDVGGYIQLFQGLNTDPTIQFNTSGWSRIGAANGLAFWANN